MNASVICRAPETSTTNRPRSSSGKRLAIVGHDHGASLPEAAATTEKGAPANAPVDGVSGGTVGCRSILTDVQQRLEQDATDDQAVQADRVPRPGGGRDDEG